MNIEIYMKDGTVKKFLHESIKYEGSFAIVIDEYRHTVAIPVCDIKEIKTWLDY